MTFVPNNGLEPSRRLGNGLGLTACVLAMAYALYVQEVQGLEPCHLCIFQRVVMISMGVVFFVACAHDPRRGGSRGYAFALGLLSLCGCLIAGRHVWIQAQPAGSVGACGASLEFMFQMLPPSEVLLRVFRGGAECQKIDWQFLGLAMPVWTLGLFLSLGVYGVYNNWRKAYRTRRF